MTPPPGTTEARRIALTLEWLDPSRGGLERWTWNHAGDLAAAGREVHVVACGAEGPPPAGVRFHEAGMADSVWERARRIGRVAGSLNCDIVHDMGAGLAADILHPHGGSVRAWREHNLLRIPAWRRIRFFQERRYREQAALQRAQLTACRVVIAVSRMTAGHLTKFDGIDPARIRVIPNGVDCARFHPPAADSSSDAVRRELGIALESTLHLMVAHNLRLKNAECAIRALAIANRSGHGGRLLIVGGRKPARQIALARKLGLAESVTFLPPLDDVVPLYQAATTLVHPTWYDPCSLVTIEAMACGLPVITSACNGASEMIDHGVDGLVLPHPSDAHAMAGWMRELAGPARRTEVARAAREKALARPSSHQLGAFLALYDSLAGVPTAAGALRIPTGSSRSAA